MMESIEKLRELAMDMNSTEIISHTRLTPPYLLDGDWLDSWHRAFDKACDEIEREVSERYMERPVDADGVPIQVGDELYNGEVIAFGGLAEGGVVFVHRGFEDGNYILEAFASNVTHHVKPRTIEDVLAEFFHESRNSYTSERLDLVEKYAAKLRGAKVVS